jgi:ABC-2 type transport system ATP-binding protein
MFDHPSLRALLVAVTVCAATLAAPLPTAAAAPTIEDNLVIESFDGEPIVATLMLPEGASRSDRVPAILRTHGWGGERERTPNAFLTRLLDKGYAILTWDSRGFGDSGGEANVGSPDFEVKDAGALMDYLASRPEIQLDGPGDPRVGWTGGSNAAGIQFNTAALDHRVDAIVPEISWGLLTRDLNPNGVYKQGWGELLYHAGLAGATQDGLDSPAGPQTGEYAEEIHRGYEETKTSGGISPEIEEWFRHKSTVIRSSKIDAPTLIIQGSVDTLFPLEDAFENYRNLVRAGTPVKLMAYCAGHTLGCPYPGGASGYPEGAGDRPPLFEDRIVAWLDRYVKGQRVDTGPRVEWQAQDGYYYEAPSYPLPRTRYVTLKTVRTGELTGPGSTGGDGATDANPAPQEELGETATRKRIATLNGRSRAVFGVPKVKLSGSVAGGPGYVFLELVDVAKDGARVTLDDQTMPVSLREGRFRRTVALHGVAWKLQPGHRLELEITTGSSQYQAARNPYTVKLKAVTKLPIAPARHVSRSSRSTG